MALLVEQLINGLQQGLMLFLMAAGVTLVFGIMRLINLAHGSMFMLAAYVAVAVFAATDSYLLAFIVALAGISVLAMLLELAIFRPLYARGHLDQLLASFGLVLVFNEIAVMVWGREPLYLSIPPLLSGQVEILPGVPYPVYRLAVSALAIAAGLGLWLILSRTRLGMQMRGGAERREVMEAMGVNIRAIATMVFGIGACLAGVAGLMTAPIMPVQSGMGDPILILTLVVMIIGGVGSLRGALIAALIVGVVDTFGRILLPQLIGLNAGSALSNMVIYVLMAVVLVIRPTGLVRSAT
ncbi:branched-chain amino acid ABC transporter permease [Chelatococcus asaccharovorans]|uniref:branched-chain amino acid ABC transporter permease n=1 Tax=Chelatococcus asaccharovorans TaxID=28210 RepID=UPI001AED1193|nr:branched-chain amino acid ABC transporter permease [Chelatococcus asaccharovorans]MBS7707760.1 branched-chain amino acid ABC transporter permease [Chelatococcus asaccharovorans]